MINLIGVKKLLIDEFQDNDSEKFINMLGVVDILHVLFSTQDFQNVHMFTIILREDIFSPVKLSNKYYYINESCIQLSYLQLGERRVKKCCGTNKKTT